MPKPYRSRAEYYYGALTEDYSGELPSPQSREDAYLLKLIDKMSSQSGKATFTPRGSVLNVSKLPSLDSALAGDIYNIQTDSKTTAGFVEGAGVTVKGGTNVYCVIDSDNVKKWDAFGSTYAVDYALDPSSGHPLANNAVCAAIDNVTDQLNPAFVERIKTIHIPSMPVGACCKIMSIEHVSNRSWVILDLCLKYGPLEIDTVQLRLAGGGGGFQVIGSPSDTIRFITVKNEDTQDLYAINDDDTVETDEMFVDVRVIASQAIEAASDRQIRAILISDPVLENSSDIEQKPHYESTVLKWSYEHTSTSTSGNFAIQLHPYGRSRITGTLREVSCKAGDIIATNPNVLYSAMIDGTVIFLIDTKTYKAYLAYADQSNIRICEDCTADTLKCSSWISTLA